MGNDDFVRICTKELVKYVNSKLDVTDNKQITEADVYLVWLCKALQNNKCLMSTTLPDGMYYEFTYNGDKGQLYLDAYKKFENKCILLGDLDGGNVPATMAQAPIVLAVEGSVQQVQTKSYGTTLVGTEK